MFGRKRVPKWAKLSKEEAEYLEEVELFNAAGIKVCVFARMGGCEGEVRTIGHDPEKDAEGNLVKYGLRMNLCEEHSRDAEEGWVVYYD